MRMALGEGKDVKKKKRKGKGGVAIGWSAHPRVYFFYDLKFGGGI
jgi:hypothetical protein